MNHRSTTRGRAWLALGALLAMVGGCNRADDTLTSATEGRLRAIARVYLDYVATKGASPASERELRGHFNNVPAFALASIGVAIDSQTPFESQRDGAPLEIHYGLPVSQLFAKGEPPIVAVEKLGRDGKRLAVYASGEVTCIDCN